MSEAKITATATWGADPRKTPPDMQNMDAWTMKLRYKGRSFTIPFFMGYGHSGAKPTAALVLEALTGDAASYAEATDIDEFAANMGYDMSEAEDRRKVRRIYTGVERNTRKLKQFLGEDFDDALDTEGWLEAHT